MSLLVIVALIMKAAHTSETSVYFHEITLEPLAITL
jgi:hypothetical protein